MKTQDSFIGGICKSNLVWASIKLIFVTIFSIFPIGFIAAVLALTVVLAPVGAAMLFGWALAVVASPILAPFVVLHIRAEARRSEGQAQILDK